MAGHRFRIIGSAMDDTAEAAAHEIENAANDIAEFARSATERVEDWGKDSYLSARASVQENPVLWSAVSLGAMAIMGLAAAWLTQRGTRTPRRRMQPAQLRTRRARRKNTARARAVSRQNHTAEA